MISKFGVDAVCMVAMLGIGIVAFAPIQLNGLGKLSVTGGVGGLGCTDYTNGGTCTGSGGQCATLSFDYCLNDNSGNGDYCAGIAAQCPSGCQQPKNSSHCKG